MSSVDTDHRQLFCREKGAVNYANEETKKEKIYVQKKCLWFMAETQTCAMQVYGNEEVCPPHAGAEEIYVMQESIGRDSIIC